MSVTTSDFITQTQAVTYNTSHMHMPPSEEEILGPAVVWTYLIIRAIQGVLAILGNLLTIVVVSWYDTLKENGTCRTVASLALADMFAGIGPFTAIARYTISKSSALSLICCLENFFELLAAFGNVYNILLATIDRYIYIAKPLRYISIVTPRRASVAILMVWIMAIVQTSLIIAWDSDVSEWVPCKWSNVSYKIGVYLSLLQLWVITFCIIIPVYGKIGCITWHLQKNEPHISNYPPENQSQQKKKLQERKMVTTIGLVLGVYLTCYIPRSLFDLSTTLLFDTPLPFGILLGYRMLNVVYKMQSVLNPFIYGWKNKMFQRAYLKMLGNKM